VDDRPDWKPAEEADLFSPELLVKLEEWVRHAEAKADRAFESCSRVASEHPGREILRFGRVMSSDGFRILRENASRIF
jgi:hypothetical protein